MALYGYARVSTAEQNCALQEQALRAAGCTVVRTETGSGTRRAGRTELALLLEFLRPGDTLVVTRVDRLTRSIKDLQDIVSFLKDRGVTLRATEQPIDTQRAAAGDRAGLGVPGTRPPAGGTVRSGVGRPARRGCRVTRWRRERNHVDGQPFVDVEVYQPITDQIQDGKAVGRVGIGIEVNPHGVFPQCHRKRGLRVHGRDPRLDLSQDSLGLFILYGEGHPACPPGAMCPSTACTKACAWRTACWASR